MPQTCRFGYTLSSCNEKFEPPCGGQDCELRTHIRIDSVKPKSYMDCHKKVERI